MLRLNWIKLSLGSQLPGLRHHEYRLEKKCEVGTRVHPLPRVDGTKKRRIGECQVSADGSIIMKW